MYFMPLNVKNVIQVEAAPCLQTDADLAYALHQLLS